MRDTEIPNRINNKERTTRKIDRTKQSLQDYQGAHEQVGGYNNRQRIIENILNVEARKCKTSSTIYRRWRGFVTRVYDQQETSQIEVEREISNRDRTRSMLSTYHESGEKEND